VDYNHQLSLPPVFFQPINQSAQPVINHGPGRWLDTVRWSYELDRFELVGPNGPEEADEVFLRLAFRDLDRNFPEEGARFEIEGEYFFGVCGQPRPVSMSEALVRIRSIRHTFDEEGTGISQRELFEGGRAGEDKVCDGVENFTVPSELDVQLRIAER
jgi:hypothetical protein